MSDDADHDAAARDADHLRLLAVLAIVYAVFAVLAAVVALPGALGALERVRGFEMAALFVLIRVVATTGAAIALPFLLASRASRTWCAIAAFLIAWDAPAGTVLGVLALIVLARRSVALEFEHADAARGHGPADPEEVRRDMIRRAARRHARERREATGAPDADDPEARGGER